MQPVTTLRIATATDLPRLFAIRNDPASTQMAGIQPQTWARFFVVWTLPDVISRAVVADGEIVGSISVFKRDDVLEMGYIIDRAHWGRGIATRAVEAMLRVVAERPIFAVVSDANRGSRRVLEKTGFAVDRRRDDGGWVYVARFAEGNSGQSSYS